MSKTRFRWNINQPLLPQVFLWLIGFSVNLYAIGTGRRSDGSFGGYPQRAPLSGLEKLKEQYALGEIDIAKLEQGVERELYLQAHAIEAPKPAPALPAPKLKQVEPARPWHYQGCVSDYEMNAMQASYDAWLWRTREDRV